MRLGLSVPAVYIVPVERFCREMGPALGVNLAEFEFPAYFNFFVYKKRCTLIVDSEDAEQNIRRVFSETLLGPAQFRREVNPITFEEEDFAPEFPREAIPNFQKELEYFRIGPDGKELVIETLLNFRHFEMPGESGVHENLGIPRPLDDTAPQGNDVSSDQPSTIEENAREDEDIEGVEEIEKELAEESLPASKRRIQQKTPWTYSQARWIGKNRLLGFTLCFGCPRTHTLLLQETFQPYGRSMRPRSKLRIGLANELRFLRCQVVRSTFCMISTRTITLLARPDSQAM
jgi:hypothetical protein